MKKEHSLRWGNDYSTFEILQILLAVRNIKPRSLELQADSLTF